MGGGVLWTNFGQLKSEVPDNFHFLGVRVLWTDFWLTQIWSPWQFSLEKGYSGPAFGQLKSEVIDNFIKVGGFWTKIPFFREGLSIKFGHKFTVWSLVHSKRLDSLSHFKFINYLLLAVDCQHSQIMYKLPIQIELIQKHGLFEFSIFGWGFSMLKCMGNGYFKAFLFVLIWLFIHISFFSQTVSHTQV